MKTHSSCLDDTDSTLTDVPHLLSLTPRCCCVSSRTSKDTSSFCSCCNNNLRFLCHSVSNILPMSVCVCVFGFSHMRVQNVTQLSEIIYK